MEPEKGVKETVSELMDSLLTIGRFNVNEIRAFLRKMPGGSWDQVRTAVDALAKSMRESGKWAVGDVERAAGRIKDSIEWEDFLANVRDQLKNVQEVTKEAFEAAANKAGEAVEKKWQEQGKPGEKHVREVQEKAAQMAETFKKQWGVFQEKREQTEKRLERAIQAAWKELKKDE